MTGFKAMVESLLLETLIEELQEIGCKVEPCGSRVTCNPPPTDTDQDFLVEVLEDPASPNGKKARTGSIVTILSETGFEWEGSGRKHYQNEAGEGFMSWRRHDVNFIITSSPEFARRHRCATALCTRLNLMVKDDRIALFQAVLYGNIWAMKPALPEPVLVDTGDDIPF